LRNGFPVQPAWSAVPFPRPTVAIADPPEEFDAQIDWFELVSYNLVLLEEYPREEVRRALETVTRSVETHLRSTLPELTAEESRSTRMDELRAVLTADHEWFRTSLEQLWWFFGVVDREDHGGHRQALGQYGRLFAESLRRHRRDEREFFHGVCQIGPKEGSSLSPGNRN
jgi:hypothetical protein